MYLSETFDSSDGDDWDSSLYRNVCSFVPENGRELINLLDPRDGEKILDLGCGTGQLTSLLANSGAHVIGLDSSPSMIETARRDYPHLTFIEEDALSHFPETPYDAVFSNAVLHWITDHDRLIATVSYMLRPGGRFTAEFSAEGNISQVRAELHRALKEAGYDPDEIDPWYFPSKDQYRNLLESHDFNVHKMVDFHHTSVLDGDEGLHLWLSVYGRRIFAPLSEADRKSLVKKLTKRLRNDCFRDGQWNLDYHRLRFKAVKE
ncbi:MAG: trans-aconitate 2-methyltransferase [bacterium]